MAQGTGHGATPVGSLSGTVLVRTTGAEPVEVNAAERTAVGRPGAEWRPVSAAAAEHGLAVQAGSAPDVGIAGFLLSGGISWLSRSRGLAVNDVLRLEIVGADGQPRMVDQDHEPDLFWALRGGGGAFGRGDRLQAAAASAAHRGAGTLFFPMQRAGEVLHAWRRWIRTVSGPRRCPAAGCFSCRRCPSCRHRLSRAGLGGGRGRAPGDLGRAGRGNRAAARTRTDMDTIAEIPAARLSALHMDPPGPTPCRGNGMLLDDVPPSAIDALVACAGHGSGSPLLSVELRHLGGAVAAAPAHAGAVGHFDAEFAHVRGRRHAGRGQRRRSTPSCGTSSRRSAHGQPTSTTPTSTSAAPGGRDRFHDRATLDRLQAVNRESTRPELFTCGHPVRPARPR